jgi:hypothetical protein
MALSEFTPMGWRDQRHGLAGPCDFYRERPPDDPGLVGPVKIAAKRRYEGRVLVTPRYRG